VTAANYDVVIGGTAVFTIGTVTLHVTVDDASKSYGDPNPSFTVTYSGFVNGDDAGDLGGTLGFVTAATTLSPAGGYPVSVSGLTSSTYIFDYVAGTLTILPASQTISFGPLADATYGDPSFAVSATATSGLAVTFSATGACSVVGTTVTITGAGTCTVTAHQAGDANHDAAPDVAQAFTVAKASQTISFGPLADVLESHAPITLSATASSGLGVTYTVTGPCSVVGNVLTVTGVGTCAVTAHQAGNADVLAAADVTVSFDVLADPAAGSGTPSSIETDKDITSPGGHVHVTATGFEPGTGVTIHLGPDGPDVTVTADADGNVEADLVVPDDAVDGPHTIEAVGVDPNGDVLDLTTTITVVTLPQTATFDRTRPGGAVDPAGTALLAAFVLGLAAASLVVPRRRRRSGAG
jgi:hypothetical protein